MDRAATDVPLVVDLDGTLLRGDLLYESTLSMVGKSPWLALRLPSWCARGKSALKREIALRAGLNVATLPYDDAVVTWVGEQRAAGRRTVLCSASDATLVQAVAEHLGLFDEVMGSEGVVNLSSHRKAAALVSRYGAKGYDYAGNSRDDLAVWAQARRAILVAASASVRSTARGLADVEREFARPAPGLRDWLKGMRLHQWTKNLLVFLPLIASHRIGEPALLMRAILAFLAFGLCASAIYIINDLFDLESDRAHARKRHRPFASGAISPLAGLGVSALALCAAFSLGLLAAPKFAAWLLVYLGLTLLYTFVLKRKVLVDAMALAALYTLRVLAGGAAVGIWPGFWLLAFSLFLFQSLAFVKRYSELRDVLLHGGHAALGRDYVVADLPLIEVLGLVSGYSAVVVMALYMNGETISRLYPNQDVVWLTVPVLLYWVTRMWVKAHRGEMHDDPMVFAVTDRLSLLSIGAFLSVIAVAAVTW